MRVHHLRRRSESVLPSRFLALAILAAAVVIYAAAAVALAHVARRSSTVAELRDRARWPARTAAALLAALLAIPPLAGEAAAVVRHVLALAVIAAVAWLAVRLIAVAEAGAARRFDIATKDNLHARRKRTQALVLSRASSVLVVGVALCTALLTFDGARALGASVLASAGVAGLVAGIAARSTLGNLVAGLQIAFTEPIRLDDVVVVEGEWGRIEEITLTYVVVWIWDNRRLVLPTAYFVETPFQNWTRATSQVLGAVTLHVDYTAPVEAMRTELKRILDESARWDGDAWVLQVIEATDRSIELRALMTAEDAPTAWDLRCEVREHLVAYLAREHPQALPRVRLDSVADEPPATPHPSHTSTPLHDDGSSMPDLDGFRSERVADPDDEAARVSAASSVST